MSSKTECQGWSNQMMLWIGLAVIILTSYYMFQQTLTNNKPKPVLYPTSHVQRIQRYNNRWQNVTEDNRHFVFSAYNDGNDVRIVGLSISDNHWQDLYCQLWSHDSVMKFMNFYVSPARVILMNDYANPGDPNGYRYLSTFFICKKPPGSTVFAVSLTTCKQCAGSVPNHLQIPIYTSSYQKLHRFAMCVAPLHTSFNDANRLIEWIELNRIMGAEHFTFYNQSLSQNVQTVLELYSKQGLIQTVPWNLPYDIKNTVHYFGQIAAENDCLYRNRPVAEHLVFIDIDEYIAPKESGTRTWQEMLKQLPEAGSLLFRHSFFRSSLQNLHPVYEGVEFVKHHKLVTQMNMLRNHVYAPRDRSKVIVRPEKIEAIGVHFAMRMHKETREVVVNPKIGLLHHYRVPELSSSIGTADIFDDSMTKYRKDLIQQVNITLNLLKKHASFLVGI